MKAYKIEVLVIDFEDLGEEDAKYQLGNMRHLDVKVVDSKKVDIGEWDDDHPLNKTKGWEEYYKGLLFY